MWVTDMAGFLFTESDRVRLTSELFGRPPVGRARGRNRPFPGFSEVAVLGSLCFSDKMWSAEDSSNHTRRLCLLSVLTGLGAPVADVVLEVLLSDEFFDIVLECDAFFSGVANILMVLAILVLIFF